MLRLFSSLPVPDRTLPVYKTAFRQNTLFHQICFSPKSDLDLPGKYDCGRPGHPDQVIIPVPFNLQGAAEHFYSDGVVRQAVQDAQQPVPQARVSPVPRSQTRIRTRLRSMTCTNSVLVRLGKHG